MSYVYAMDQHQHEHIWNLVARKLSGEAGSAELEELELLMSRTPELHFSMEILQDLWNNKPEVNSQYSENQYQELVKRLHHSGIDEGKFSADDDMVMLSAQRPARQTRKSAWIWAISLFFILAVSAGLFLSHKPKDTEEVKEQAPSFVKNEISTRYGAKSKFVLPDGTTVFLNAGSTISYDKNFGNTSRWVQLSGEAYFDVVKNPSKPFIIHTRNMDIKVVGTAFNVKCYPGEKETETSLVRGSIEITLKDRAEKIVLKPNEKLVIHDDQHQKNQAIAANTTKTDTDAAPMLTLSHLTILPDDNSIAETSWLHNKLVFRGERFDEIAVKMERWFAVSIDFSDDAIRQFRFTGIFEKESLVQALNALQLTTAFNYTIKADKVFISQ